MVIMMMMMQDARCMPCLYNYKFITLVSVALVSYCARHIFTLWRWDEILLQELVAFSNMLYEQIRIMHSPAYTRPPNDEPL